ncbi:MAG TPA: ice-binding family protein [Acidimicrobiales bacterium]|nr:ice-binding family protein [Acidimicrobiales bacterium]
MTRFRGKRSYRAQGGLLLAVTLTLGVGTFLTATVVGAAQAPVGLGTAGAFAVLGGAGVTNTGPTIVNGDLGTCPTPSVTNFPPGIVNGATHQADAVACGAQDDLTIAYNDAAGRAPTVTYAGPTDLGGSTLTPGVYKSPSSFAITGTLTLDAQGDPNAVFIFQVGSTLITATNSKVLFTNGAQACNVFWQVGSSATLGVGSTFVGTILALTSIEVQTGAVVAGRVLTRNASTTLDTNVISLPACAPPATTTTAPATTSTIAPTTTAPATTSTIAPTTTTSTIAPTTTTSTVAPTTTSAVAQTVTTAESTTTQPNTAATTGTVTSSGPPLGAGGGAPKGSSGSSGLALTGSSLSVKASASAVAAALGTLMVMLARRDSRRRVVRRRIQPTPGPSICSDEA